MVPQTVGKQDIQLKRGSYLLAQVFQVHRQQ
jgi:hypothetical protein